MGLKPAFYSAADYDAWLPERLPSTGIEEACIYSFMMRLRGKGLEAICWPASVANMRETAGRLAVVLCLKNGDLTDLKRNDGYIAAGLWTPTREDPFALIGHGIDVRGTEGYFMPYDDGVDMDELLAVTSHSNELVSAT